MSFIESFDFTSLEGKPELHLFAVAHMVYEYDPREVNVFCRVLVDLGITDDGFEDRLIAYTVRLQKDRA